MDLDAYGVDRAMPKQLGYEDLISRQLDRIAYLRSMGHPWAEALYQLRDELVGLEDAEFWDGVPPKVRESLKGLDENARRKAVEPYRDLGWNTCPVRAIRGPRGPIFRPTAEDLSRQLRILMRLLDRHKMLRKSRRESTVPKEWLGIESD